MHGGIQAFLASTHTPTWTVFSPMLSASDVVKWTAPAQALHFVSYNRSRESAFRDALYSWIAYTAREMAVAADALFQKLREWPYLGLCEQPHSSSLHADALWESYALGQGWIRPHSRQSPPTSDCLMFFQIAKRMFDKWVNLRNHLVESHFDVTYPKLDNDNYNDNDNMDIDHPRKVIGKAKWQVLNSQLNSDDDVIQVWCECKYVIYAHFDRIWALMAMARVYVHLKHAHSHLVDIVSTHA